MGIPRYVQIQEYVKEKIEKGIWPGDTLIPTEAELQKQFACSRITVTTALRELVKDGMIYRIQGKGTFVAPRAEKGKSPMQALELSMLTAAGEHSSMGRRVELPSEEIAHILHLGQKEPVFVFERMKYIGGEASFMEVLYLPQKWFAPVWDEQLEDQYVTELSARCGITIGPCHLSSAPILCDAVISTYLKLSEGSPIIKYSLEILDTEQRVVAYLIIYSKGIQHKIPYEIS